MGQVYDSHFNLLREFNVKGEFCGLMELDDAIVIQTYKKKKKKCFIDVRAVNNTQYDAMDNEHYSTPDITLKETEYAFLYIARIRDIASNEGTFRCGVYIKKGVFGAEYSKYIDCKYDSIEMLSLKEEKNTYFIGVTKTNDGAKCDFYVKDILLYQGLPFNNGNPIRVLKSGYFINVTDSQGINRIIRKGKVIFSTKYEVANTYVQKDIDADGFYVIGDTYLIVVAKDNLYGIYSSTGKMLLPIKYSTIDIDERFYIVLGIKVNPESFDDDAKKVILQGMRNGEFMQIGEYSKEFDEITRKAAIVDGDEVEVEYDREIHYIWNNGFGDFEIVEYDSSGVNVPSNWDDYSYEDSLYDALGGEMDAKWNID